MFYSSNTHNLTAAAARLLPALTHQPPAPAYGLAAYVHSAASLSNAYSVASISTSLSSCYEQCQHDCHDACSPFVHVEHCLVAHLRDSDNATSLCCFSDITQAVNNFQHELTALRRSFRYDEYEVMEAPPNFIAKVRLTGCIVTVCYQQMHLIPARMSMLGHNRNYVLHSRSSQVTRLTYQSAGCWCCWACHGAWAICC